MAEKEIIDMVKMAENQIIDKDLNIRVQKFLAQTPSTHYLHIMVQELWDEVQRLRQQLKENAGDERRS